MEYPLWYLQVYGASDFPKNEREYWARVKEFVIERDGLRCQACRKKVDKKELTVHHIVPRSEGGTDDLDNLVTLHFLCHDFVEVNGYKTLAQIRSCTKNLDKAEMQNAVFLSDIQPTIKTTKPTIRKSRIVEEDRQEIVCPCGIYHIRKQSEVGTKTKTIDCICGRIWEYVSGEWKWRPRFRPTKTEKSKVEPPQKKRKPLSRPLETQCPVCGKKFQYRPRGDKFLFTCGCGSQAIRRTNSENVMWFCYVKLYRDVSR